MAASETYSTVSPLPYLGLAALARFCPSTRDGKPVHSATLTRWILKGVRLNDGSVVKLAAKRFPGGWASTREALDEFVDRLTADRCGDPDLGSAPVPLRTPVARRRAIDRAEAELASLGI